MSRLYPYLFVRQIQAGQQCNLPDQFFVDFDFFFGAHNVSLAAQAAVHGGEDAAWSIGVTRS